MADKLTIPEADAEVKVIITDSEGDTPNLFVWDKDKLIAKIWLYPDGSTTPSIPQYRQN